MKTYNKELADCFNEIADLLGIKGEGFFTIRAYKEGLRIMEEVAQPIGKKEANLDTLQAIEKIGEALALKIIQYIETGKMKYLEELRKEIPKSVRELLNIPGLGPGRVGKLYKQAGVDSKDELIKQAKNGSLEALPGFGKKTVEKILDAIATHQEKKKRHERSEVERISKKIIPVLKKLKGVGQIEIAGSFRRQSETVGDMDMLITGTADPKKADEAIRGLFDDFRILGSGDTKISFVIFPENLQVDLRFVPEESYGAALLYFTGSKEFNVKMRKTAISKNYLLNEYGLFEKGEYIAGKTEKEVFEKLEMNFVAPEDRK